MLDPGLELCDLHIHVGGAVAPHILWSIAHEQGFKLPVSDLLGVSRSGDRQAGDGLVAGRVPGDPAPLDREDSVVAGGDRALGLRDHRQGVPLERRVAHRAALQPDEAQPGRRARPRPHHPRGAARDGPRLPRVRRAGGPHLLPGARVLAGAERDPGEEGGEVQGARRGRDRSGRPRVAHAGAGRPRWPATAICSRGRARRRSGPRCTPARPRTPPSPGVLAVLKELAPARIGHGIAAAASEEAIRKLVESGTVLEICPSSNLRTRAVGEPGRARPWRCGSSRTPASATRSTPTARTCLNTHLRLEYEMLLDNKILSEAEVERSVAVSRAATFVR